MSWSERPSASIWESTTAAISSPRAAAAKQVASTRPTQPSRPLSTTISGSPRSAARSALRRRSVRGEKSPPAPSTIRQSLVLVHSSTPSRRSVSSITRPSALAAWWGASGRAKDCGQTADKVRGRPAASQRVWASWGPPATTPLATGLEIPTRIPSATSVRRIIAATNVLPASVSVPVTKRPGNRFETGAFTPIRPGLDSIGLPSDAEGSTLEMRLRLGLNKFEVVDAAPKCWLFSSWVVR